MTHIDEHTLEMYVMGGGISPCTPEEIEAHLLVCSGCRALTDTMRRFYAHAQAETSTIRARRQAPGDGGLQRRATSPVFAPIGPPAVLRPGGWVRRSARLVQRHPVASTGTALTTITIAALLLIQAPQKNAVPGNPVECRENYSASTIEMRNSASEVLWRISVPELNDYRQAILNGWKPVQFADLDGDGKNEVLTCFQRVGGFGEVSNRLLIFRSDGSVYKDLRVGSALNYRDRAYPNDFHVVDFLTGDFSNTGKPDILVLANNNHSPAYICRIDGTGQVRGTYRHFGHLGQLFALGTGGHSFGRVIALGLSDIDEGQPPLAVVILLEPSLLIGDIESSHGRGFGYSVSPCELQYANIPASELAQSLGRSVFLGRPRVVGLQSATGFRVMAFGSEAMDQPVFEYIFDQNLGMVEVKSGNETRQIFDTQAKIAGIPGPFYDAYLTHLSHQVRYWSGSAWGATPVSVHQ